MLFLCCFFCVLHDVFYTSCVHIVCFTQISRTVFYTNKLNGVFYTNKSNDVCADNNSTARILNTTIKVCPDIVRHINVSKMASLGVWGTEVEIFALATILNTTVFVFSKCGETTKWLPYEPLKKDVVSAHDHECILLNNLHEHFEPANL